MARVERLSDEQYRVDGEFDVVYVLQQLDDEDELIWTVIDGNEGSTIYFRNIDRQACIDYAKEFADTEQDELDDDPEIGDGMTDAEADANVLASAGWGTDEDYGYYGHDD